jgi:hypothetical protein
MQFGFTFLLLLICGTLKSHSLLCGSREFNIDASPLLLEGDVSRFTRPLLPQGRITNEDRTFGGPEQHDKQSGPMKRYSKLNKPLRLKGGGRPPMFPGGTPLILDLAHFNCHSLDQDRASTFPLQQSRCWHGMVSFQLNSMMRYVVGLEQPVSASRRPTRTSPPACWFGSDPPSCSGRRGSSRPAGGT